MEIKIDAIWHEEKIGKESGKPFTSCSIMTTRPSGQVRISGFGDHITRTWSAGDVVDVDVAQRDKYWNFTLNDNSKAMPTAVELLKELHKKIDQLLPKKVEDTFGISADELPN